MYPNNVNPIDFYGNPIPSMDHDIGPVQGSSGPSPTVEFVPPVVTNVVINP